MSDSHSTTGPTRSKHSKPYPDFPLFPHAGGVWAKKIRGKMHYFGPWEDADAALAKYLGQKDDVHAGHKPRPDVDAVTVKDVVNAFLNAKQALVDAGELSPRTWADYKQVCDLLVSRLGKARRVDDLRAADFPPLRDSMAKRWGPHRLNKLIQFTRGVFKFAYDSERIAAPVRFGPGFNRPSKKTIRLNRAEKGPKLFSAEEIRGLLGAAGAPMKAMVLLGVNCGFGNADCGRLPLSALDLERGWADYPRPKTGVPRRCPHWPETVAAVRDALAKRPEPKAAKDSALVFITKYGAGWCKDTCTSPVSQETAKLLRALHIDGRKGLSFYTLRHTFRTIADAAKDQPAADGGVTKVRAVGIKTRYGRPHVESGYFDHDHLEEAAKEAARLSLKAKAKAVYFVPNPIAPDLLARRANRVERVEEGDSMGEKHITGRRWLLVDADPARDAKISASDAEKSEALALIQAVRDFLGGRGWPAPILADSGNGYHLLYRIDLPAGDSGLVKRVLQALSQRFTTSAVKIDTAVHNSACPTKLYGTVARKGDDVAALNRVHRRSQLQEVPGCSDPLDVTAADVRMVAMELLEALAAEGKATPPHGPDPSTNGHGYNHRLDVPKWLTARGVDFRIKSAPASGARTVYLITCPFDASHTGADTCIMQEPSGKMSAHCFHDSCNGRGWQDFKEKIGKPDGDHYDPPMGKRKSRWKEPSRRATTADEGDGARPDEGGGNGLIVVNDRQLPDVTADALEAVRAANNPPRLFQRSGLLTRIRIDRKTLAPWLQVMSEHAVRGHIARVANWMKVTEESAVNVPPPMDVVRDIIALDEWEHIPALHAVIETPVFAGDGRLVSTLGYDGASCLYYRPACGLEIPAVPEKPTADEIQKALRLLQVDLLGDFPFNDGLGADGQVDGTASRAHAIAAVLLPFVRELIDGPTPFHLFDAPVESTGKTLLVSSVSIVAVGRAIEGMAEATSDEEWRKRITAALVEAPTFVFLDNLNRILDSGALARALTATVWKDRVLGSTKTVSLPNNAVWLGSGNNTKLSRELIRRTIWCRLDARTDAPWERTKFRHKHLIRWAKANRGQLVGAALTLCQAWIAAGRPPGQQTLGMFDAWVEVMGGILDVAGVPGLLANAKRFRAAATDKSSEWREFVAAWCAKFAGEKVGVDGLFALAAEQHLLDSVLGAKGERSQRTRMGMALSKMRDRVIGDYHVVWVQEDHSSRQCYRLELAPKELAKAACCASAPEGPPEPTPDPDAEAFDMEG